MNIRAVAKQLGGDVAGQRVLAPGPGHSAADRSLQITLSSNSPDGFLVHSFCGDDWKECRDYVRQRLGLPEWQPGDEQDRSIHPKLVSQFDAAIVDQAAKQRRPLTEDDQVRISRALEIWNASTDPRGTLAERYLCEHRRLDLPDDIAGSVLRFNARTPWRNENTGKTVRIPALIAAFRSIDTDAITGIHRIALNADGKKIDRRMLGVVYRAAVKLGPCGDELAVGEGIETAMAARQLGVQAPCWALGSVGAISFFPIIPNVRTLRILGEDDAASEKAIQLCAKRWRAAGLRVRVVMPTDGKDLNDALFRRNEYGRAS